MIPLTYYLVLSAMLFCIGIYGVLTKKNAIYVLMSIEIMLNAVNINFVSFSAYSFDVSGQVFALFSIGLAAAEVAIGLAIFLLLYKRYGTVELQKIRLLRW